MKDKFYYILLLIVAFAACNQLSDEEKAALHLQEARTLIAQNQLNAAKNELDSVHILYPREVPMRRIAKHLSDSIVVIESKRTLAYCDSLLPQMEHVKDSLIKNFRFEHDTLYMEEGQYVHRLLRTESNAARCYLQAYITESAKVVMKSTYCGNKAINYNVVELTSNEISISSVPGDIHKFETDGMHYETLLLANDDALPLLQFMSEHMNDRIKVTLKGGNSYIYYLSESERKALGESYHFAVVMKDIVRLKEEQRKAKIRIEQKMNK